MIRAARGRASLLALAAALLAGAATWIAAWAVYEHTRLRVPPPLSDGAHAAAVAILRQVVDGGAPARPGSDELARRRLPAGGPAIVTLWVDGRRAARVEGRGPTAADALLEAATRLAASPELAALAPDARRRGRLQVDLVVARGPFWARGGPLRTFGLLPGMDGLGVTVAGRDVVLGADELVESRLLLAARPLPTVEFDAGLDFPRADARLAMRASLPPGAYGGSPRRYFRFRAESFVERPEASRAAPPLPLTRGLPPAPPTTRESLLEAARLGGRYLVAHLLPSGRFVYELDLPSGEGSDPSRVAYSLPRHAGTTYYLAQLYGATRDPALLPAIERAIDEMAALARAGGCAGKNARGEAYACVSERGAPVAGLGSTALAAVTLAEYRQATGETRFDDLHRAMLTWILDMQLPPGHFAHLYHVRRQLRDERLRLLYYDGEAALALARGYAAFGDPRYLAATERALDALVGFYDATFAGQFFFGEEHWTCIAAEAAWPGLKKDRYRRFCIDYAAFLRDQQFRADEIPGQADLAGAYGVTPFFMPHNTPAGSRTEAMISAYLLTVHHGRPDDRIRRQVLAAAGFLLGQQVREEAAFSSPADAIGAMPGSAIDRNVRIDYVQHTCSAMLRAVPLVDGPPR